VLPVSFSAPRIVAICDGVPPSESDFVPAPLTLPRPVADAVSRPFVSARVIVKVSLDDAALSVSLTPEIEPPEGPSAGVDRQPDLPAEFIIVCAEANEQDLLPRRAELPDRVGRRIGADFGVGQRKSPWLMGQGLFMNAGCGGRI
jgi:hypothetical protein